MYLFSRKGHGVKWLVLSGVTCVRWVQAAKGLTSPVSPSARSVWDPTCVRSLFMRTGPSVMGLNWSQVDAGQQRYLQTVGSSMLMQRCRWCIPVALSAITLTIHIDVGLNPRWDHGSWSCVPRLIRQIYNVHQNIGVLMWSIVWNDGFIMKKRDFFPSNI